MWSRLRACRVADERGPRAQSRKRRAAAEQSGPCKLGPAAARGWCSGIGKSGDGRTGQWPLQCAKHSPNAKNNRGAGIRDPTEAWKLGLLASCNRETSTCIPPPASRNPHISNHFDPVNLANSTRVRIPPFRRLPVFLLCTTTPQQPRRGKQKARNHVVAGRRRRAAQRHLAGRRPPRSPDRPRRPWDPWWEEPVPSELHRRAGRAGSEATRRPV